MEFITEINNKKLYYLKHDTTVNWATQFPVKNWLLIPTIDDRKTKTIDDIVRKSIERNVCYVCCTGKEAEYGYESFEEIINVREVENEYLPSHKIMTSWNKDLIEGVKFALFTAEHEKVVISKIIILDSSEDAKAAILKVIAKLKSGKEAIK